MNRYEVHEEIGQGTFGNVFIATKKGDPSQHQYAVKRLKQTFASWDDVSKEREFCAIRDLCNHPEGSQHLVRVYEIAREQDGSLAFVMEYMQDGNLHQYLEQMHKNQQENRHLAIPPSRIESILFQCLQGLRYIHGQGYIHRDVKTENIMMNGDVVKLGDFSLARKVPHDASSSLTPPRRAQDSYASGTMTTYVATRWYRAPELLRIESFYSRPVDIFALGCVAAELYLLTPLFQGKDDDDQLRLVQQLLSRDEASTQDVVKMRLAKIMPMTDSKAIDLLAQLLEMDPAHRITANSALQHGYFQPEIPFNAAPFVPVSHTTTTLTPNKRDFGQLPFVTVSKAERKRLHEQKLEELEPNRLVRAFLYPNQGRLGKRKLGRL